MRSSKEKLFRIQPSGHSRTNCVAGVVWQTTTDGFNLNSETPMTNETQCIAVMININVFAVYWDGFCFKS